MEKELNTALAQEDEISAEYFNNELVDLQQSLDEIRVWLESRLSSVSDAKV